MIQFLFFLNIRDVLSLECHFIYIYIFLKIQEMGNLDNYLTRFISSNVGN